MTPVWAKVWPLTQFYSVNFSQSRISVKVCSLQTHNRGLRQLFSTVSLAVDALYMSSSLYSFCSNSKARDERDEREKYFPDEGSLICPTGKSMICYKKSIRKTEFAARPAWRTLVRACYAHPGQVGLDLVVHLFSHGDEIRPSCIALLPYVSQSPLGP